MDKPDKYLAELHILWNRSTLGAENRDLEYREFMNTLEKLRESFLEHCDFLPHDETYGPIPSEALEVLDKGSFQLENGIWFDKNTYNFKRDSWVLAEVYSEHFDKWFNKNTYNFKESSWGLARYCSNHLDKWFDKETYNFDYFGWALAQYCSQHFDKWFDLKTYNFETSSWVLEKYCQEHKDKWEQFIE